MLTGDQRLTAQSVAGQLGLLNPGERVLDGLEVDRMSDETLRQEVGHTAVFSRVSPEAKLRIVGAYQAGGEIVAMLGDGANDAAALRKADIGVAMGKRGTDLAKEAADLILEDDRFATIGAAVEQGRIIFDNIRKFVFYLFSCNLAEILVLLGAGVVGLAAPLLPLQILWLNLVTDTFPALALAVEPGAPGVMRQPPRDPAEAILSSRMLRAIAVYAALIAVVTLIAFFMAGTTAAFMTLAFAQILHLGNARSRGPVLTPRTALANRAALAAVVLAAGLQLLAVFLRPLAEVLLVTPLSGTQWALVAVLSATPAVAGQLPFQRVLPLFARPADGLEGCKHDALDPRGILNRLERDHYLNGRTVRIRDDALRPIRDCLGVDLRDDKWNLGVHPPRGRVVDDDCAFCRGPRAPLERAGATGRKQRHVHPSK
jgi:Ca2+-transporting ATPase